MPWMMMGRHHQNHHQDHHPSDVENSDTEDDTTKSNKNRRLCRKKNVKK